MAYRDFPPPSGNACPGNTMYRPCTNSAGMKGFVCDPSMGMRTLAAACSSDYGMAPQCGSHPQGVCKPKDDDEEVEPFVALSATGTKWLLFVFFIILIAAMIFVWSKTKKSDKPK
jgi:hypothetical protein